MKTRAEKLRLAGQQPGSRYFWRSQRKIARYKSAVRRHLPASGHGRCNFSAEVAPTNPAQWRTWNENQSRKAEVSRAAAEFAIFLAITEENCPVYIGSAATFTCFWPWPLQLQCKGGTNAPSTVVHLERKPEQKSGGWQGSSRGRDTFGDYRGKMSGIYRRCGEWRRLVLWLGRWVLDINRGARG